MEVFRDLGPAFAAVLVLIYVLVVGWFRSFVRPLVIMAPIPLTLVGILPAPTLMGAFFTATSMIGFIARAGIIVRNSIILVDFIELRRSQGRSLEEFEPPTAVPVLCYLSQRGNSLPPMHPQSPESVAECETPQCEIV